MKICFSPAYKSHTLPKSKNNCGKLYTCSEVLACTILSSHAVLPYRMLAKISGDKIPGDFPPLPTNWQN